ncbi:hypothetical protein BC828DRAFT_385364 [Blastocladiella britannica]|nr:hypothetical protein BC828DRAFT_385364 [Blastocladiella britannica]
MSPLTALATAAALAPESAHHHHRGHHQLTLSSSSSSSPIPHDLRPVLTTTSASTRPLGDPATPSLLLEPPTSSAAAAAVPGHLMSSANNGGGLGVISLARSSTLEMALGLHQLDLAAASQTHAANLSLSQVLASAGGAGVSSMGAAAALAAHLPSRLASITDSQRLGDVPAVAVMLHTQSQDHLGGMAAGVVASTGFTPNRTGMRPPPPPPPPGMHAAGDQSPYHQQRRHQRQRGLAAVREASGEMLGDHDDDIDELEDEIRDDDDDDDDEDNDVDGGMGYGSPTMPDDNDQDDDDNDQGGLLRYQSRSRYPQLHRPQYESQPSSAFGGEMASQARMAAESLAMGTGGMAHHDGHGHEDVGMDDSEIPSPTPTPGTEPPGSADAAAAGSFMAVDNDGPSSADHLRTNAAAAGAHWTLHTTVPHGSAVHSPFSTGPAPSPLLLHHPQQQQQYQHQQDMMAAYPMHPNMHMRPSSTAELRALADSSSPHHHQQHGSPDLRSEQQQPLSTTTGSRATPLPRGGSRRGRGRGGSAAGSAPRSRAGSAAADRDGASSVSASPQRSARLAPSSSVLSTPASSAEPPSSAAGPVFIPTTTKKSSTQCRTLPDVLPYPEHLISITAPIKHKRTSAAMASAASTPTTPSPLPAIAAAATDEPSINGTGSVASDPAAAASPFAPPTSTSSSSTTTATGRRRNGSTAAATSAVTGMTAPPATSTLESTSANVSPVPTSPVRRGRKRARTAVADPDDDPDAGDDVIDDPELAAKLEAMDPKEAKRIRNTLSARKSRARKAAKIDYLENHVNDLVEEISGLRSANADLQAKYQQLRSLAVAAGVQVPEGL